MHEALTRNWERLRGWLNEDRGFMLWRQCTQFQVEQCDAHRCDPGYLLHGAVVERLAMAAGRLLYVADQSRSS